MKLFGRTWEEWVQQHVRDGLVIEGRHVGDFFDGD
jgi:hypothetical protein